MDNNLEVKFSRQCLDILRRLEIDQSIVRQTCNNRTRGMVVPGNPMQIYATSWHENKRIIYINGNISRSEKKNDRLHIQEVTLSLALQLKEKLPAGSINRNMSMEEILKVVANSFGLMISLNQNASPARLYQGIWHGNAFSPNIQIMEKLQDDLCFVTGVFNNNHNCHHVWMFSYKKYSSWFIKNT